MYEQNCRSWIFLLHFCVRESILEYRCPFDFITSQTFSQIKLEANLRNINHCFFSDFIVAMNTCVNLLNQTHVPIASHYPDSNVQACSFIDLNAFSEDLHACAFRVIVMTKKAVTSYKKLLSGQWL